MVPYHYLAVSGRILFVNFFLQICVIFVGDLSYFGSSLSSFICHLRSGMFYVETIPVPLSTILITIRKFLFHSFFCILRGCTS